MGNLNHKLFLRLLTRSRDIAAAPGVKASVASTFTGVLDKPASRFEKAHKEVMRGESAFAKEDKEAREALGELDQSYREARSVVMAFVPTAKLPATLKSLDTDTDKLNAIEALLDVFDEYVGQPWADEQRQGEFGQRAAAAVKELGESIAANRELEAARNERAEAFGPAYEAFIRFKRVVRDALGSASKAYRSIHVRSPTAVEAEEPEEGGGK